VQLVRSGLPRPGGTGSASRRYAPPLVLGATALLLILLAFYALRPAGGPRGGGTTENGPGPAQTVQEIPPPVIDRPPADLRTITIDVPEAAAEVYRDGRRLGATPYPLQARVGERVELTLRKQGFRDTTLVFEVTASMTGFLQPLQRNR
jgi:hypothetical protein